MILIRILFLISIFFSLGLSKGEVSKIFAHKEDASNTTYNADGHNHQWGRGQNIVIDAFEYNGHRYDYVSDAPIVKIRRVNNNNATGEPCGLFAEKYNGNNYQLAASFPNTNGNCDMAKVMGGRIINVGALDVFRNVGYTAKNVERVDFISPQGITTPSNINDLSKAGHVVTEKSGNNYMQIAAILSIDANNNPTSFGPLIMVHKNYDNASNIRYGMTGFYFPDGSYIGGQNLGFYVDNTSGEQGEPWYIQTSNEALGMAFVTLEDLGVSNNQTYYGFSYFGRDVSTANDVLTDISTYPRNTGGDTADPYGGVASYFVDEEILYDFGDAPSAYPHVSHKISSNLYLGEHTPDNENDQQSSANATGDGDDDNDGVITLPILSLGDSSYTVPVKVFNNTGSNAYITAWIDFNRNGKFEFHESLNINDLTVPSSASSQTVNVVWDSSFSNDQFSNLTVGQNIMRIRLTSSRILRCDSEHYSENGNYNDNYFVSPNGEVEDYQITVQQESTQAFSCSDTFYVSNQHNLETGSANTNKNWLHSINRNNIPYSFNAIGNGFTSTDGGYNAIGYNIQDNFIYGMYGNILVKIDSNGIVQQLGKVTGVPSSQRYTGEFDRDGYYYLTGGGGADNQMYKIDIALREVVETITLSQSVRFWDMAIDASGEYFYAMLIDNNSFNNYKVAKIKISDGTVTTIGNSHESLTSYISLVFSDIDGDIFMMSNENGFYKVNTTTGELTFISSTQDLTFYNDGTSCANANISEPTPVVIAEYHFDECLWNGTNNEVKNSIGNIHGKAHNGLTTDNKGRIQRAGEFDKAEQHYIDFGDNYDITGNKVSISVWFKSNSTGGEQIIYNKESQYEIAVKDGYLKYAFRPHWHWDGGTSFNVEDDTWYHVVITYDGQHQRMYKNGVEVYSRVQTGNIGSNAYKLLVGARNSNTPRNFFDGSIDEFKIYDNALSAEDISTAYQNELSGKNWNGTPRIPTVCTDLTPTIYVSDESIIEGNTSSKNLDFTVYLDKVPNGSVTFEYQVLDGNGNHNAHAPIDFTDKSTLTPASFNGTTQQYTIHVPIHGDKTIEENEKFRVLLSNIQGAYIGNASAMGTIINDDTANPCDPVASGNKDTDGDNISDVCDLDNDNDGILNTNESLDCSSVPYPIFSPTEGPFSERGSNVANPTIGDSFRYTNVYTGVDAIVTFSGGVGTTINNIDIDGAGLITNNLQPVFTYANATSYVDVSIQFVNNGTTTAIIPDTYFVTGYDNDYNEIIGFDDTVVTDVFVDTPTTQLPYNGYATPYTNNSVESNGTGWEGNINDTRFQITGIYYKTSVVKYRLAGGPEPITGVGRTAFHSLGFSPCGPENSWNNPPRLIAGYDSDNDGIDDYLDLDSDNDGIPDNVEAQTTQNYIKPNKVFDADGVDTAYTGGLTPVNTDGEDEEDYHDLDSDNDGVFDIEESGLGNNDTNNDGRTNALVGVNGLDNSPTHETADNYLDVNGLTYDAINFNLQDLDNDTAENGLDAAPMGKDFDYRDDSNDVSLFPITCQNSAFMFHGKPTESSTLNLTTGDMLSVSHDFSSNLINAAGYNKKDAYIWAYDQFKKDGTLLKIGTDLNGDFKNEEYRIPNLNISTFIADIDDNGYIYFKEGGKNGLSVHVVDLDPSSGSYLTKIRTFNLSRKLDIHDWAFNPLDDQLYAITKGSTNYLYRINPTNGTVTLVGDTQINKNGQYGASFFDKNGHFYVYNNSGNVYKIDVQNSPIATLFSNAPATAKNDGAMCSDVEVVQPPTLYISNEEKIEGNSGVTNLEFTVSLDKKTEKDVSFNYQVFNGNNNEVVKNAKAPSDYTHVSGSVTLSGNTQLYTISVPIKGDEVVEDNEEFRVVISNVQGAILGNPFAIGTILNDDSAISWGSPTDLDEDNDGILDDIEFGDYPNLVQNPSFEADNCSDANHFQDAFTSVNGTFLGDDYNNNQLTGWNYSSNIDCWVEGTLFALTPYGTQYVDLQGNLEVYGTGSKITVKQNHLTQTITTIPGKTYRFSFWWGEDVGHKVGEPIIFTMKVSDKTNNTMLSNETLREVAEGRDTSIYAGPNQWYNYEAFFVATSTKTKLDFSATPPAGNLSAGADIDMVSVKEVADHDEDGIPDFLDLDSDNDGIPDTIETQTTQDYIKPSRTFNENGVDFTFNGGFSPIDTDGDGIMDYLDLDSDNDGVFDIEESGLGNNDTNNDGRTNALVGVNGLDNTATHEINDTIEDVNGMAYDGVNFRLKDSDNDTNDNGDNAAPMGTDFDYRDNLNEPLIITANNLEQFEGDSGETEFTIPITLNKPAPVGGVTIEYIPYGDAVYSDDFSPGLYDEFFQKNPAKVPSPGLTVRIKDAHKKEGNKNTKRLKFEIKLSDKAPTGGVTVQIESHDITATEGEDYTRVSSSVYIPSGKKKGEVVFLINGDKTKEATETFEVELLNPLNASLHNNFKAIGYIENDDYGYPFPFPFQKNDTLSKASSSNIKSSKNLKTLPLGTQPLFLHIPEGSISGEIKMLIQGDTSIEENEPFNIALSTSDNATFNVGNNVSKSMAKKTTVQSKITSDKEIIVVILNDDNDPAVNIAEYRFDCLARDKYMDFSSNANHIISNIASEARPNSNIMCNAVDGYPSSGFTIKDQEIYHEDNGSISFWMYDHHTVDNTRKAMTKGAFTIGFQTTTNNTTGQVKVALGDGSSILSTRTYDASNPQWIFVTVTFKKDGQLKLYMDGVLEGQGAYDNSFNNTSDINVAAYSGMFDEFYLYAGSMSQTEVTTLHEQQLNNINIDGSPRDCSCADVKPGIIADYRFDSCYWAGIANEVIDSSDNAQNLNKVGTAQISQNGKINNAGNFDVNGSQVEGLFTAQLDNEISINTWFKTTENQSVGGKYTRIIEMSKEGKSDNSTTFAYDTDGKTIRAWTTSESNARSATVSYNLEDNGYHDGQWHMLTFTYQRGVSTLYVDALVKTTTTRDIGTIVDPEKLSIGGYYGLTDNSFKGEIDETLIFSNALMSSEITEIYNNSNLGKNWDGSERNATTCVYPSVSINDVTKKEGDSGYTEFDFTVTLDSSYNTDTQVSYTINDGTATVADNDYIADSSVLEFLAGETIKKISVKVVGDYKMEYNENFTVDLENPILVTLTDTQGVGTIINDDIVNLNIERINSANANSLDYKYNLFTQIAKKDFDYSIVSYDENSSNIVEKSVSDLTVKVELIDATDSNTSTNRLTNTPMVATFNNSSRINIINNTDLQNIRTTRNAYFKIYYPVDVNDSVIRDATCATVICLENLPNFKEFTSVSSRDSFSIRPAGFKLMLSTNEVELQNNTQDQILALTAGHDYELDVYSLGYTNNIEETYEPQTYKLENGNIVLQTIQELNATLIFDDNKTHCNDTENHELKYYEFDDGKNRKNDFSNDNVGAYKVSIKDINWTNTDISKNPKKQGCILNSHSNQVDENGLYGCLTSSLFKTNKDYHNMEITFEPYAFTLDFQVLNLPNNKDYAYMSNLNLSNKVGTLLDGNISAISEKGNVTSNFTESCHAKPVNFSLDYSARTHRGDFNNTNPLLIQTTEGNNVNIQKRIQHNEDEFLEVISTSLDSNITISKDNFEDNRTGISDLAILYNIDKPLSQTVNPIEITYENAKVSSKNAKSHKNKLQQSTPIGNDFLNKPTKLYYARVAPDLENYPDTYEGNWSTPISIEVFCNDISFCQDLNITDNAFYTMHTSWFAVKTHDLASEGNYTLSILNDTPDQSVISDNIIDKGKIKNIHTIYSGTYPHKPQSESIHVDITPSPWLKYHADSTRNGIPFYKSNYNQGQVGTMSGTGKTGNILNLNISETQAKRLDW